MISTLTLSTCCHKTIESLGLDKIPVMIADSGSPPGNQNLLAWTWIVFTPIFLTFSFELLMLLLLLLLSLLLVVAVIVSIDVIIAFE